MREKQPLKKFQLVSGKPKAAEREKMKKMNINFRNSTIELSKAAAKAASTFDTEEYEKLIAVRTQFPNFKVVIKETAKKQWQNEGLQL